MSFVEVKITNQHAVHVGYMQLAIAVWLIDT